MTSLDRGTRMPAALAATLLLAAGAVDAAPSGNKTPPVEIQDQGSFLVGGSMITNPGKFDPYKPTPDGQTYRGDHAYVFYQVPVNARKYPLIMWHGIGQFSKTWETTPDGREGFQNILLRRGFSTYVLDQPRRGRAGRSMAEATIKPVPDEQNWFGVFRIGIWPNYFPGVQFSRDPAALDQYFRQITPNLGPIDLEVTTDAGAKLLEKTGPAILLTHSHAGGMGWKTVMKSTNVRGVVSFEPGSNFPFPEGSVPAPEPSSSGPVEPVAVSMADFQKLTRIPIVIYYGDNIPKTPNANPGQDGWRARLAMARKWRDAVNQLGGDVTVVHLPEVGIKGNTHFPFSDLNNLEIADLVQKFLESKDLASPAEQPAPTAAERELIELSRKKWLLMAAKDVKALDALFHEKASFVHMGATMSKADELRVIESGRIEYKQADVENVSVTIMGDTAVLLSRIQLFALVGGNEARNPFSVTETFVKQSGEWRLAALAFTRLITPQSAPTVPAKEKS